MPDKCYEKLVSNLILDVCGHRKMNSLFERFSIKNTILDRILLETNFGIKTQ